MYYSVVVIKRTSGVGPLDRSQVFQVAADFEELNVDHNSSEITVKRIGGLKTILKWDEAESELFCEEAESDVIALLIQLAEKLGARVCDEFYRTYRTPYETFDHPDDSKLIESLRADISQRKRRFTWRNRLAALVTPVGFLLVIFLLNFSAFWPRPEVFSELTEEEIQSTVANAHLGKNAEVIFIPISDFSFQFLTDLARETNRMTGLQIRVATPRPMPSVSPYHGKNQYDAVKMVASQATDIEFLRQRYGNGTLIYFTNEDINQGDSQTRFVFSHQDYQNRIAMISARRLVSGTAMNYAPPNLIRERLLKFTLRAVAELNLGMRRVKEDSFILDSPIRGIMDVDELGFAPFSKPQPLKSQLLKEKKNLKPMHPAGVLMCVSAGVFCIAGASLNWNWFFWFPPAPIFVSLLTRTGARIFYMLLGVAVVAGGILGGLAII